MLRYVRVPQKYEKYFEIAELYVQKFFSDKIEVPEKGVIKIGWERYLLVRADSLSNAFFRSLEDSFGPDIAKRFMYQFAKTIGGNDAQYFEIKMNLTDAFEKFAAGPVHFSFSGWAFVEILPESVISSDENFCLIYNHPNTFESETYIERFGKSAKEPLCVFSAGYSTGWCSQAFGMELDAKEIMCIAQGDSYCRFIMAPPHRLEERIESYRNGRLSTE